MADSTVVHFEAGVTQFSGRPVYVLHAHCTDRGGLPDVSIFLLRIEDASDPTLDVFTRVVTMPDLDVTTGYGTDRNAAILAGKSYWRSAEMVKYFDEVDVAVEARRVLEDEINRVAGDHSSYTGSFYTTGEDKSFPVAQEAIGDALKAAYATALSDFEAAQAAQEDADAALTAAQNDYNDEQDWVSKHDLLATDIVSRRGEMSGARTMYDTYLGTAPGTSYNAAWAVTELASILSVYSAFLSGDPGCKAAIEDLKTNFEQFRSERKVADIGAIAQGVTNHNAMNANTYIPHDAATLAIKEQALTDAQTAKVAADATVSAKYTVLEATYTAAKSACPDWQPDEPMPPRPA